MLDMDKSSNSHAKELVRERTGRDPEGLLRELYVDKRHTQWEIAEALGVHRMTISIWLREYGINREDRGPLEISA